MGEWGLTVKTLAEQDIAGTLRQINSFTLPESRINSTGHYFLMMNLALLLPLGENTYRNFRPVPYYYATTDLTGR